MSVFWNLSSHEASIKNDSTSDVYLNKKLCVYKIPDMYNSVLWSSVCSSTVIGRLNTGEKRALPIGDRYTGNTTDLPSNRTFWETQIITTIEWLQNKDTFLKWELDIRVARPSVNTLGGWATLLNGSKLSDINNLSKTGSTAWWPLKPDVNKNLILSSLWIDPLSSYVKQDGNTRLVQEAKKQGNDDVGGFAQIQATGAGNEIFRLPDETFNGFSQVFIHKWSVTLSKQKLSWANTTYIIQWWDLKINGNIEASNSVLFVVKGGNVIISGDVERIDAIIIALPELGSGGHISWDEESLKQLMVNGALYGNVDDLLGKRTYIKNNGEYVEVWTNVNFTSKVFSSPPPLLSRFLSEYWNTHKVAQ